MKVKHTIISTLFLIAILVIIQTLTTSNSGGAAGNTVNGCGAVGSCHGVQSNLTSLALTGIPATGYVSGQTYTLTASIINTSKFAAGLDIIANIGTFTAGVGTVVSGSEITHTTPLLMSSGTATWQIEWTAPTNSSSNVTFIFAGNAVNNNTTNSGDAWAKLPFVFNSAQTFVVPTLQNVTTTNVTSATATATATINANNTTTTNTLQYGTTIAYGNAANASPNTTNGNANTIINYNFNALTPNTMYHYRFSIANSDTTIYSADQTFTTLLATSIKNIKDIGIAIYPNPTTDVLNIICSNLNDYEINIFDMLGKQQAFTMQYNKEVCQINTALFAKGNYVLIITKDGKIYTALFYK